MTSNNAFRDRAVRMLAYGPMFHFRVHQYGDSVWLKDRRVQAHHAVVTRLASWLSDACTHADD